jgi:NadR type nicotinamide-nucleotide adenylyltransferase
MMKKIVIVGPESTGKSTISQELCQHYSTRFATAWVPEYAREYLDKLDRPYTYEDLVPIAKGQLELEEQTCRALQEASGNQPSILFIDTDMMVMQVWSEFVFDKCDSFILNEVARRNYDHYLLMQTDLPWTFDILREYPDQERRNRLFQHYYDILQRQNTGWSVISGLGKDRTNAAIKVIDNLLAG